MPKPIYPLGVPWRTEFTCLECHIQVCMDGVQMETECHGCDAKLKGNPYPVGPDAKEIGDEDYVWSF